MQFLTAVIKNQVVGLSGNSLIPKQLEGQISLLSLPILSCYRPKVATYVLPKKKAKEDTDLHKMDIYLFIHVDATSGTATKI